MRFRASVDDVRGLQEQVRAAWQTPWTVFQGWMEDPHDPARALEALPHLRLRDGWGWVGWLYSDGANGHGVIHALPEDAVGTWTASDDAREVPTMPGVRPALSAVIADGSASGWLQLALLALELGDYGAAWHGISWRVEELLGGPNAALRGPEVQWKSEPPNPWVPVVDEHPGGAVVTLHTWGELGRATLTAWRVRVGHDALPEVSAEVLAEGEGGFVF